jgi:hypothetical protein
MLKKLLFLLNLLFSLNIFSQNKIYKPAENYFNYIIVEKSNFDFENDKEFNKKAEYIDGSKLLNNFGSWHKFPSDYKMFDSISTEKHEYNWIKYKDKIIELSKNKNLDHISLTKCLEIIKYSNDDKALLPIAAYQCKNRKHNVWIIICLWEYLDIANPSPEILEVIGYPNYGHIRKYAIDVTNFEIIAFETCK